MAESIEIRPVQRDDLDAWVRLRLALWPDGTRPEFERDGLRYFERPGSIPTLAEVLLLVVDGQPVGLSELSLRPYAEGCVTSPVAFLEGWYVEERWRRRGWGTRLLRAAEAWAGGQGCTEFASDASIDNAVSRAAHRAAGFEEVESIVCFRKSL